MSVQIQLQIVWEEISNCDVFHEEDFDPSIDQNYNDAKTTFDDDKYQGKIKGNNHYEYFYHLCAEKLKQKWKQNTTDEFPHFIRKFAPTTTDRYEPII